MEDRRKAWVHTLAGTNGDMSRFGVMHPCGVAEAQRAIKRPKAKTERIAFAPIDQPPVLLWCAGRTAAICIGPKIAQIEHAQQAGAAREHARPLTNASHLTSSIDPQRIGAFSAHHESSDPAVSVFRWQLRRARAVAERVTRLPFSGPELN